MPLAPEIKIELNEIEKNINSKVQDLINQKNKIKIILIC